MPTRLKNFTMLQLELLSNNIERNRENSTRMKERRRALEKQVLAINVASMPLPDTSAKQEYVWWQF